MGSSTTNVVKNLEAIRRLPLDTVAVKGDSLGDTEVAAIVSLKFLRELDLSGCEKITDYSLSELRLMSFLEKVDLSFCNQITDLSLISLSRLPALRSINLNWCYGVTDSGLKSLGRCISLESVSLWGCEEITDEGVQELALLPNLKALELPEFAAITNRSLGTLSESARKLESLRLDNLTHISDEGLQHLGALKQLRSLTVKSCPNVSFKAIHDLQQLIPECQITL